MLEYIERWIQAEMNVQRGRLDTGMLGHSHAKDTL